MFFIFWLLWLAQWLLLKFHSLQSAHLPSSRLSRHGRQKQHQTNSVYYHRQPKPEWVRKEIIRLKALLPDAGCRTVASIFNRRFRINRNMTVGKSYVSDTVRAHQYDIQVLRRNMKHRKPKVIPRNLIWGLDLTGKTDTGGQQHSILCEIYYRIDKFHN